MPAVKENPSWFLSGNYDRKAAADPEAITAIEEKRRALERPANTAPTPFHPLNDLKNVWRIWREIEKSKP